MRFMDISAFVDNSEISNFTSFYASRLDCGRIAIGDVGAELLGYMFWPNDPVQRKLGVVQIREWLEYGEQGPLPPGLRTAQQHWARFADIIHLHHDMNSGGHQQWRGGASSG